MTEEKLAEEYAEKIINHKMAVHEIFEKEAEEYFREQMKLHEEKSITKHIKDVFKDGAKFGYNKANEWHYMKDEFPKELHDVLCFAIHNEHRYVLQGYLRDGRWVLSPLGTYLNNEDVIAWKEIVLPELPKE